MKNTWSLFKKHPIALIFLVVYSLLCIRILYVTKSFSNSVHQYPDGRHLALGEGIAYGDMFLVLIGVIAFLIIAGHAITIKRSSKFYLCIMSIIVIETIAALTIY